jgi:hypothetical protein
MSVLASSLSPVKPSRIELTDTPQPVPIRKAQYVAVYVTLSEHGTSNLQDIPKRRALRLIAPAEFVLLSELFGTVVIGRPEPPSHCRCSCCPSTTTAPTTTEPTPHGQRSPRWPSPWSRPMYFVCAPDLDDCNRVRVCGTFHRKDVALWYAAEIAGTPFAPEVYVFDGPPSEGPCIALYRPDEPASFAAAG